MIELKSNIEKLAREEGKTELEVITLLQAISGKVGDEETLDALCLLKADYIKSHSGINL